MKKTVAISILALAVAGAANASSYVEQGQYDEFHPEHKLNLSYSHYDVDGNNNSDADGAFVEYQYNHKDSDYGLVISADRFDYDEFDTTNARFGMNYAYTVKNSNVDIVPEVGVFHVDTDFSGATPSVAETSYYYGVGLSTELVEDQLYGKVYYQRYDIEDDIVWGDEVTGLNSVT